MPFRFHVPFEDSTVQRFNGLVTPRFPLVTGFVTGWTSTKPNVHAVCYDVTGPEGVQRGGRALLSLSLPLILLLPRLHPSKLD